MNKFLHNKYSLLDSGAVEKTDKLTDTLRAIMKNTSLQVLLFAILMSVIIMLAEAKVIPDILRYSWITPIATTLIFSIAAIGFCLLMGYSGLASLGTGGFIGIGSYSIHFIVSESGLPFFLAMAVAIVVAVVIGIIVGFISLRIEGIYLVILTLAISEILRFVYQAVSDKIDLLYRVDIAGMTIKGKSYAYIVIAVLAVIMIITMNLIKSPTGRAMLAMKNSTAAAQAMGIGLMKYRLMAFVLCTAYAALAGTLLLFVVPTRASTANGYYSLITSLNILAAVIIGGYKSVWGAVFGCFVMFGFDTIVLQNIDFIAKNPDAIPFISGILVILIVMFYPGGFAQLISELRVKIKALRKKLREGKYGKDLG